jgi:hypothetical protein
MVRPVLLRCPSSDQRPRAQLVVGRGPWWGTSRPANGWFPRGASVTTSGPALSWSVGRRWGASRPAHGWLPHRGVSSSDQRPRAQLVGRDG